jgi:hypothetical protein
MPCLAPQSGRPPPATAATLSPSRRQPDDRCHTAPDAGSRRDRLSVSPCRPRDRACRDHESDDSHKRRHMCPAGGHSRQQKRAGGRQEKRRAEQCLVARETRRHAHSITSEAGGRLYLFAHRWLPRRQQTCCYERIRFHDRRCRRAGSLHGRRRGARPCPDATPLCRRPSAASRARRCRRCRCLVHML